MPSNTLSNTALFAQPHSANIIYTVFLAHGYDETTLPMLAESLQVPLADLSERYPTTYQIWYNALCQATEELFDAVSAGITADTPLEQLRQACRASLEHSLRHPQAHRFISMPRSPLMREPEQPAYGVIALRSLIKRLVKRCIKDGIFSAQSPEIITQGIFCLLHGVTDFLLNIQRIPWVEGLAEHLLDTYFAGLAHEDSTSLSTLKFDN